MNCLCTASPCIVQETACDRIRVCIVAYPSFAATTVLFLFFLEHWFVHGVLWCISSWIHFKLIFAVRVVNLEIYSNLSGNFPWRILNGRFRCFKSNKSNFRCYNLFINSSAIQKHCIRD